MPWPVAGGGGSQIWASEMGEVAGWKEGGGGGEGKGRGGEGKGRGDTGPKSSLINAFSNRNVVY